MNNHTSVNNVFISTLAVVILFLLAATFSAPVRAATDEGLSAKTTAPTVVAWYYGRGYRYYYGPYRGWYRAGYVCPRTCWRGPWGGLHCARRC